MAKEFPLSAIIFDLDGTLVDSNDLQVRAWMKSFDEHGYQIGKDRIESEVGKGGDQLVESVLGKAVEDKDGECLRDGQTKNAHALIESEGVAACAGAADLLAACRDRGLRVALATSSSRKIQNALLQSAGIPASAFDLLVTGDDVKATKPQADLYHVTIAKLDVSPAECVNVGDTPYDCIAARRAGLVTIGLSWDLNGSTTLRQGGARWTVRDVAELYRRLDEGLGICGPGKVRLTYDRILTLMQQALDQAETALRNGEAPIGAVIAAGDGSVIGRGYNRLNSTRDKIHHAEIGALHDAARTGDTRARDWIMVSTLEPCVMCMGAALEAGIDTVLFGLPAPADGGPERVTPPVSPESQMPRVIGRVLAERSRQLFDRFLSNNPPPEQANFVRQLLRATAGM